MSITDCDITSFPRSRSDRVSLTSNGGKCKGDDWQTFRSFPVTEFYNLESQHAKTARGTFLLLSFFVITLPKNHTNIWLGTRSYQLLPAPTSSYQLLPAPTSSPTQATSAQSKRDFSRLSKFGQEKRSVFRGTNWPNRTARIGCSQWTYRISILLKLTFEFYLTLC